MDTRAAGLIVVLIVTSGGVRAEELGAPSTEPRVRIVARQEAAAVRAAVEGANRRLQTEECRRILTD